MLANGTEILLKTENLPEAAEVLKFFTNLSDSKKKDFLIFIRGAQFAENMNAMSGAAR